MDEDLNPTMTLLPTDSASASSNKTDASPHAECGGSWFWRQARKIVVLVVGVSVVLIGLAGLLLPVLPGWALIFVGLFILGSEFAWARWVLKTAKVRCGHLVDAAKQQWSATEPTGRTAPGERDKC